MGYSVVALFSRHNALAVVSLAPEALVKIEGEIFRAKQQSAEADCCVVCFEQVYERIGCILAPLNDSGIGIGLDCGQGFEICILIELECLQCGIGISFTRCLIILRSGKFQAIG